ncbi:MAG: hypothetical protein ACK4IX_07645 [Candidatus Sericytochromatia bacterium]
MTQIYGNNNVGPVYNNQQSGVRPATYVPGAAPVGYRPDQYNTNVARPQQGGVMGGILGGEKKPYVTRQSVVMAAGAAAAGFMIAGPIGAIIGAIVALLASVFMNISKMKQQEKAMQQQGGQVPAQGYNTTYQQQYQQRMQQQQMQQTNQIRK